MFNEFKETNYRSLKEIKSYLDVLSSDFITKEEFKTTQAELRAALQMETEESLESRLAQIENKR
jgi:DNA-binding transcriptional MerR regulator